jgi:hypothetical protein
MAWQTKRNIKKPSVFCIFQNHFAAKAKDFGGSEDSILNLLRIETTDCERKCTECEENAHIVFLLRFETIDCKENAQTVGLSQIIKSLLNKAKDFDRGEDRSYVFLPRIETTDSEKMRRLYCYCIRSSHSTYRSWTATPLLTMPLLSKTSTSSTAEICFKLTKLKLEMREYMFWYIRLKYANFFLTFKSKTGNAGIHFLVLSFLFLFNIQVLDGDTSAPNVLVDRDLNQ